MRKLVKGNSYRVTLSEFITLAPKGLIVTNSFNYYFYADGRYLLSQKPDLSDPNSIYGLFSNFSNIGPLYVDPISTNYGTWVPIEASGESFTVLQEPNISKIRRH